MNNERRKIMSNEVQELLAKIGEAEILRRLMVMGEVVTGKVPLVSVKADEIEGVKYAVIKIDSDPHRLVMDEDRTFYWYNAEGPEE